MIVAIQLHSGGTYYTHAESVLRVKQLLANNTLDPTVLVFWYSTLGKRYEEEMYIDLDAVKYIMSESDLTPWEEG